MTTKYYVDNQGDYLGGFDGAEPPEGAIEVSALPQHGTDLWDGAKWVAQPARRPPAPVTADKLFQALKAKGVLVDGDVV